MARTNIQSKIKVNKSGFKRSRFNWNHDVNTTFNWGEIQPTQCKLLIPNSKTTMKAQSLIRLAPMVAPTFGRVKYKTFSQFVGISEIFPNFDAMMAQEPKSTQSGTRVPAGIPYVVLGSLCSNILHGARATLYFANNSGDQSRGAYWTQYRIGPNITPNGSDPTCSDWFNRYSHLAGAVIGSLETDAFNNSANGIMPNVNGITLHLGAFGAGYTGVYTNATDAQVVLGAQDFSDLCPVRRNFEYVGYGAGGNPIDDYKQEVTFESADYVLEGSYEYTSGNFEYFALAVELSDFGKRLRKIIQGCGYQIDFVSNAQVSILPLLAQYKAYFDVFGLQLYQGWETTHCAKLIKYIENDFIGSVTAVRADKSSLASISNTNLMLTFLLTELANEWYSESADYIGAHLSKLAVSPIMDNSQASSFINVRSSGNSLLTGLNLSSTVSDEIQNSDGTTHSQDDTGLGFGTGEVGGIYTTLDIHHSQIDAEMLKRMYRWVNRNSILGREIAKLLRAQGLGKYVDECKSNFIGTSDVMVTISDVVSTAATEDASLGEYGGRGLQYDSTGVLSFENDVYGYWITLATVVPESGYTQGLDPTLRALGKFDLYNPDFDAVGMELTPKETVLATSYITDASTQYQGYQGFGFIPRYSKFKVCQNLANGDFNRHGKRSTYLPYTLDKQININDFSPVAGSYEFTNITSKIWNRVKIDKSSRVQSLPIAGNVWRMPTKYNWLGNFNRIFLNVGQRDDFEISAIKPGDAIGFMDYNDDNFLCHCILDVQCYAPMKPIEDSYGLEDDDADHAGAEFVSKS